MAKEGKSSLEEGIKQELKTVITLSAILLTGIFYFLQYVASTGIILPHNPLKTTIQYYSVGVGMWVLVYWTIRITGHQGDIYLRKIISISYFTIAMILISLGGIVSWTEGIIALFLGNLFVVLMLSSLIVNILLPFLYFCVLVLYLVFNKKWQRKIK